MEQRLLGRTGVTVSQLCLGAMMFGRGGTRTTTSRSGSSTPRWTPGSTSSTPPTCTRRGESEEIVGKALAGRRDDVVLATKFHGPMGEIPTSGQLAALDHPRGRGQPAPPRHRPDRPLPDPPAGRRHGHRRDARGARPTSSGRARCATSAARRSRPARSSRRSGGRATAACERFVSEQPPYSLLVRGVETDVLPDVPALRHGRHPLGPARRAAGCRAASARRQDSSRVGASAGCPTLRHLPAGEPAQARRRRAAVGARRGGGHHAHRARARVRAQPPGDHVAIIGPRTMEHLEAQLAAADVDAHPTSSTASTRSSRRAWTSTPPTAVPTTLGCSRERAGGRRHSYDVERRRVAASGPSGLIRGHRDAG